MGKYLDKDGVTTLWAKIKSLFAKKQEGIFYVEGGSESKPFWTGTNERITSYYDGLAIAYKINSKGSETAAALDINNLGNRIIKCNNVAGKIGDFNVGAILLLIYKTIDGKSFWECVNYTDTKNTTGTSRLDGVKMYLVGSTNTSSYNVTNTVGSVHVDQYGSLYVNNKKVSLQGHRHDVSEIDNAITIEDIEKALSNTKKIFCIDLVADITSRELDLEGGQVILGNDLLAMVYGDVQDSYGDTYFGISVSVNNGMTQTWLALVNNDTDEVKMQSGYEVIFDEPVLEDLNELSNYHIEVFTLTDYEELQNIFSESGYYNIQHARNNLTYLCTIRLSEDKTKWIIE